ncbi:circumsporozoite protein-like [Anopheles arabiensis]|uniref:circumsporozoite protein-like n=1 Tax=Anopheles arabiensis TaxID=7173 RepID=UPI001AAD5B00|nr:circumsporozoite protein-like [Anopheles arabiensis]
MNAGLSKIHFVNTTGVSLNDRFTTMTKPTVGFGAAPAIVEAPRPRANSVTRATESNRRLVDQWDQLHALQALGVKAVPVIRPARQRLQRNNSFAQHVKRTIDKLTGGVRRLPRSNSFTDIATMTADRLELLQRVRGRAPTISSRLGAVRSVSRGRSMSRGRSASRTRSNSRGRQPSLTRSNSQTNLRRAGSRTNLSRAGSRTNLTRAGSRNALNVVNRKPIAPNDARRRINRNNLLANRLGTVNNAATAITRGRSRSRSRVRGGAPAVAANVPAVAANGRARSRSRKRAGSRARAGSVNSRLGMNRTNEPAATAGGRAKGGRVTKRNRNGPRVNASIVGTRAGRPQKREAPKRKGAGGKAAKAAAARSNGAGANGAARGRGAAAAAATAAAPGRRGRSRSRRDNSRVRGRSASKNRTAHVKQQPKSREELDSELDQYMANTKSSLDKEMDQYMNGI